MDRAVSRIDFRALAGKKVFIDESPLKGMTDSGYLVSTIRQHVLASGAIFQEKKDKADYIVEVRAGTIGTDRDDLLFGIPAMNLPTLTPGAATQIPEVPLVKRTNQKAVSKIAVFVYNRKTGRIIWQSGDVPEESKAKDLWVFGTGPFQRGSIYNGTKFAGDSFHIPLIDLGREREGQNGSVSVAEQAFFIEPKEEIAPDPPASGEPKAGSSQQVAAGTAPQGTPPGAPGTAAPGAAPSAAADSAAPGSAAPDSAAAGAAPPGSAASATSSTNSKHLGRLW